MTRLSAAAVALLVLAAGCVSAGKIRADSEVIKAEIDRAKRTGAKRCAPAELATAEANLEFASTELDQGSSYRAAEHLREADASTKRALELAKECAPKQVVVKEPTVIKIEETDLDGDGVLDKDDRCPDRAGPLDNQGCPIEDRDQDGIPDPVDRCVDQPEDMDGFQDEDGCPEPDNDNDGLLDGVDKCPMHAGPIANQGCPDTDNDGIIDPDDACPNEPGVPEEKGCPRKYKMVVVTKDKIEIKQQIKFRTGSAKIVGNDSFEILKEVAQAIQDNPQIKKIRVEGHTDSVGSDATNLKLSQNRANSVMSALVKAGIDPTRLEAVGYGETRPIASNATAAGRRENRRTEFNIIEQ